MKKLEDLKIADNTIVIFVGDNGTARYIFTPMKDGSYVQGGKATTLETGTAVPMLAKWGKYEYLKHTTADLVDFTDFLPTFAEAMKIDIPAEWDVDGVSFLPLLKGEKNPNAREWVFVHYKANHVPQAGLECYAARYFKDHRYKLYSTGQFYDFVEDPQELRPLKQLSPEAKAVKEKFKTMMDKLPKWDLTSKNVPMVVLPGLEPESVGAGRSYQKSIQK